jgi:N-acetylglutamate synthase-like GNAT family acetyltransferase
MKHLSNETILLRSLRCRTYKETDEFHLSEHNYTVLAVHLSHHFECKRIIRIVSPP